jgi:hypothetical protein
MKPLALACIAASALAGGCMLFFPVPGTGKGCHGESAGFYPAANVVRLRAARELECPVAKVAVEAQSDTTFHVSGCGKREVYECEADAVSGCSLEDASLRESCSAPEE